MGQSSSRNTEEQMGLDEYRYPPASGLFFGDRFLMGGEEFSSMNPEAFLFGPMNDLNFLARIPGTPPYIPPNIHHTNTIRSLFNVSKDSVRLVRQAGATVSQDKYSVEFTFDADTDCHVTIHFVAEEQVTRADQIVYISKHESMTLGPFERTRGYCQKFSHVDCPIDRLNFLTQQEKEYSEGNLQIPIVIVVEAWLPDPDNHSMVQQHSHATFCSIQTSESGQFSLQVLVQKVNIDGLSYVLKEIFGIENNTNDDGKDDDEKTDDMQTAIEEATECVVCMSEGRDTIVLPCRHLCLCNPCAEVLRFQANKCPICRATFHSLLQLRVAQKASAPVPPDQHAVGLPIDYRAVSVAEALFRKPEKLPLDTVPRLDIRPVVADNDDDFGKVTKALLSSVQAETAPNPTTDDIISSSSAAAVSHGATTTAVSLKQAPILRASSDSNTSANEGYVDVTDAAAEVDVDVIGEAIGFGEEIGFGDAGESDEVQCSV